MKIIGLILAVLVILMSGSSFAQERGAAPEGVSSTTASQFDALRHGRLAALNIISQLQLHQLDNAALLASTQTQQEGITAQLKELEKAQPSITLEEASAQEKAIADAIKGYESELKAAQSATPIDERNIEFKCLCTRIL